jgi:hypothetical protein
MAWGKYEFIECLGVLPEVGEDDLSYSYRVEKNGLRLELTVFPRGGDVGEAGDVYLDLFLEGIEEPILTTRIMQSPGARYIKHTNGWECLEIAAPDRNVSFEEECVLPIGVRLRVNPQMSIEMFQPSAG